MTWSDSGHTLVGIIADDQTGGNATGILLSRRGFRTASLTGLEWPAGGLDGYDCVAVNTESRALPRARAYANVAEASQLIISHGGRPMAKRIDSTLRGNLGSELEAVLAALGPGSVAVLTAAFPASGRTTVGGYHYVNGVLLAETPVKNDPLCPIHESHVRTLVAGQTGLTVDELPLAVVRGGGTAVAETLKQGAARGVRVFCADAETDADITALGEGMAASGLSCVAADPGPLTAAFVTASLPRARQRVLVVAGSVSSLSRQQIDNLEASMGARMITVDAAAFTRGPEAAAAEVARAVALLAALPPEADVIGVRTGELLTLPDHTAASEISVGFAAIARQALNELARIGGVYTTGGDISIAVCRTLGAGAIQLVDEVIPLAAFGRILGGSKTGLAIVTKGGLVGGPDAAILCVGHILKEVNRSV